MPFLTINRKRQIYLVFINLDLLYLIYQTITVDPPYTIEFTEFTRRKLVFKKKIRARCDVLLYIHVSLLEGQSFKRINQEREAQVIYPLTTDRQNVWE